MLNFLLWQLPKQPELCPMPTSQASRHTHFGQSHMPPTFPGSSAGVAVLGLAKQVGMLWCWFPCTNPMTCFPDSDEIMDK